MSFIKRKIYCGIGSRQTPSMVLAKMIGIAQELAAKNWILRSGRAEGADKAFEHGCDL
jgi:predicted Rossmann fold nucleotide-binding protein DprA/Smf involved in DNA uptake